ncbi:MAG: hypothetical protein WAM04_05550 [Candidatus Sulfotelmatobacter sp.]
MLRPAPLLAIFLFIVFPLFGQQEVNQTPSQPGSQPGPAVPEKRTALPAQELAKLTAPADLVFVPVVVTDKSGKHVSGLQKEVFRIQENGSLRTISVFEEIKTEKLVAHKKDSRLEGYTNFVPGDEHPWRLTTIVLDVINTPWMRQSEAKKQLIDYLVNGYSR